MNIGIYAKPFWNPFMDAVAEGFDAIGHKGIFRNPGPFYDEKSVEPFDLVAVYGFKGRAKEIFDIYRAAGVDCLVCEWGHVRTPELHYQVGVNRLNWFPNVEDLPGNRLKIFGLQKAIRKRSAKSGPVLVLGQVPDDAQHGMDREAIRKWGEAVCDAVTERDVVWRPHPADKNPIIPDNVDAVQPPDLDLEEGLAGVHAVVTYNSSAGIKALSMGIPVFTDPAAEFCNYSTFTGSLPYKEPVEFSAAKVTQGLNQIAHTNYTQAEIATGRPLQWYLDIIEAKGGENGAYR